MAIPSKRQKTRVRLSRSRRRQAAAPRRKAVKSAAAPEPPPLEKVMFVIEPADLAYLNTTVASLKAERRRTSKSELIRLGIAIMKNMDPDELRQHLRDLD
jgi:hypothetical protein